jgi:CubicO group peptidase (beta-lactamase class C family)
MPLEGNISQSEGHVDRPADISGHVAPGFAPVADEFARNVTERGEVGAAFTAVVDGEVVVDLWYGLADRDRGIAWEHDTLSVIFSGTKGLVATCLLLLIERGQLDLEAPVSTYWPEFAAAGKEDILVRHVVSHQAGLPGVTTPLSIEDVADHLRMAQLLADQRALSPPAQVVSYHAWTFGWLCGELIRRVDGRSVGRLFREDVAEPLDLDIWIGLPERHEQRVAVLQRTADFGSELPPYDPALPTERDRILWSIVANPPRAFDDGCLAANTRLWHAAEIPAALGIGTASSIARLYGCLARGGEIDGVRVLSPATLALGRQCLARGDDPYLDRPLGFGVGFQVGTELMDLGAPTDAFGHGGAGGSVHGAWPSLETGFSYTLNLLGASDEKGLALLDALHQAVVSRKEHAR